MNKPSLQSKRVFQNIVVDVHLVVRTDGTTRLFISYINAQASQLQSGIQAFMVQWLVKTGGPTLSDSELASLISLQPYNIGTVKIQ